MEYIQLHIYCRSLRRIGVSSLNIYRIPMWRLLFVGFFDCWFSLLTDNSLVIGLFRFLFLHESVLVGCKFLGIYIFLLRLSKLLACNCSFSYPLYFWGISYISFLITDFVKSKVYQFYLLKKSLASLVFSIVFLVSISLISALVFISSFY